MNIKFKCNLKNNNIRKQSSGKNNGPSRMEGDARGCERGWERVRDGYARIKRRASARGYASNSHRLAVESNQARDYPVSTICAAPMALLQCVTFYMGHESWNASAIDTRSSHLCAHVRVHVWRAKNKKSENRANKYIFYSADKKSLWRME